MFLAKLMGALMGLLNHIFQLSNQLAIQSKQETNQLTTLRKCLCSERGSPVMDPASHPNDPGRFERQRPHPPTGPQKRTDLLEYVLDR